MKTLSSPVVRAGNRKRERTSLHRRQRRGCRDGGAVVAIRYRGVMEAAIVGDTQDGFIARRLRGELCCQQVCGSVSEYVASLPSQRYSNKISWLALSRWFGASTESVSS